MGKWIVQQMPKNPPARMPHVELECSQCGYRIRYEPGFDPYQPVVTWGLECPFCPVSLVRHVDPADFEYLVADGTGIGLGEVLPNVLTHAEVRRIQDAHDGAPHAQAHAKEDGPQEG